MPPPRSAFAGTRGAAGGALLRRNAAATGARPPGARGKTVFPVDFEKKRDFFSQH